MLSLALTWSLKQVYGMNRTGVFTRILQIKSDSKSLSLPEGS